MRALGIVSIVLFTLTLAAPAPTRADLRISDLDVYLNDQEVTVVRFTVQLRQYHRFWRGRLLMLRQSDYRTIMRVQ